MKAFKKIPPFLMAAAVLPGCQSAPAQKPAPSSSLEQRLGSIMGADISTAVGILGFPAERREEAGRYVYVWSGDRVSRLPATEVRMGSYATDPTGKALPADSPCRVELSADSAGRIAGFQWSGSDSKCSWVLNAFARSEQDVK